MDKKFTAGIGFGFVIFAIMFIPIFLTTDSIEAAIPPTPAFQYIATNDTDATTNPAWINATTYNDDLWIISDGSILIEIVQYQGGAE